MRAASRAVATLALLQFEAADPHIQSLYEEIGTIPGRGYFVVRAAPLGRAAGAVVAESFAYFPPALVAKIVERAWDQVEPAAVVEATVRHVGAMADARWGGRPEVEALMELLAAAVGSTDLMGRTLASAWAAVEWPDSVAARLFGLATVVREYRGDGHILAHQAEGHTALEGYLLAKAGEGGDPMAIARSRSWRDEDLAAPMARLESLGLLAGGEITAAGRAAIEAVEARTDELTRIFDPVADRLDQIARLATALAT